MKILCPVTPPVRVLAALVGGGLLMFAAGCSDGTSGAKSAPSRAAASPSAFVAPSAEAGIRGLATRMGCTPQMRGKPSDYRQAVCATPSGKYVINTFDSDKGQWDYLRYSAMYGGTYLIGTRWVLVATPQLLESARGRLGGRIQDSHSIR
ncbi:hypothetical protein GCM10010191_51940 [Actinomadura vinacea]|uniref:DUF3558 domain-containing protein n=1 Tax=Actinomadura vinacea TaxID=115336 RepID=A0ABN3JLJ1_9ACTN